MSCSQSSALLVFPLEKWVKREGKKEMQRVDFVFYYFVYIQKWGE